MKYNSPLVLSALVGGILVAGIVGCSHDSGGGATANPASGISPAAAQTLSGHNAVFESMRSLGSSHFQQSRNSMGVLALATLGRPLPLALVDSTVQTKSQSLTQAVSPANCTVNFTPSANASQSNVGAAAQFLPFVMSVSGNNCPVNVSLEMDMAGTNGAAPCQANPSDTTQTICNFTASVKMNYQVLDDHLAEQLQVRSGEINMSFNFDQTLPADGPNSGPSDMSTSLKGDGQVSFKAVDLSGNTYSVSGEQKADLSMTTPMPNAGPGNPGTTGPQVSGQEQEDLQFQDQSKNLTTKLDASISINAGQLSQQYSINGVAVSAQDYNQARNQFANSLMAFGPNSNTAQ